MFIGTWKSDAISTHRVCLDLRAVRALLAESEWYSLVSHHLQQLVTLFRLAECAFSTTEAYISTLSYSYRRVFFSYFPYLVHFSRNFSIFQMFLIIFPKYVKFNFPEFFVLENFTNSARTPPYLDTRYLSPSISKLRKFWGKSSPIRMSLK